MVLAATALMLVITVIKGNVHYSIFTGSAYQLFVMHENPYNRPLDEKIFWQTLWLYSPTGALLFLPFSFLPSAWGLLFYVGGSLALFISGIYVYCKAYLSGLIVPGILSLLLLSETLGAIQATKFELLTCGLMFWIFYLFAHGGEKTASILLGFLSSIKFQTLPTVGLLGICFLREGKLSSLILVVLSFLVSLTWPWLVWPSTFARGMYSDWFDSLTTSASLNWAEGQSLPVFVKLLFNLDAGYSYFSWFSLGVAVFFAVLVGFVSCERRRLYNLCFVLGAAFTVLFSPLSQSSSYVLVTPLVLLVYFILRQQQKMSFAILGTYWVTTSLLYSDLVPKAARQFAYNHNLKPVGTTLLVFSVIFSLFSTRNGNLVDKIPSSKHL